MLQARTASPRDEQIERYLPLARRTQLEIAERIGVSQMQSRG